MYNTIDRWSSSDGSSRRRAEISVNDSGATARDTSASKYAIGSSSAKINRGWIHGVNA